MDAKSFSNFLKNKLIQECQVYENNLKNASYESVGETKRAAGIMFALDSIVKASDALVEEFYNQGGNVPQPIDPSVDASVEA